MAWVGVAITHRLLVFYQEVGTEAPWIYWGDVSVALGLMCLLLVLGPIWSLRAGWLTVALATTLTLGHLWFWRYHADVPSLGLWRSASQLPQVAGDLRALLAPRDWLLAIDLLLVLCAGMIARFRRGALRPPRVPVRNALFRGAWCVAGVLLLLFASIRAGSKETETKHFNRLGVVAERGLLSLHLESAVRGLWSGRSWTQRPEDLKKLAEWFDARRELRAPRNGVKRSEWNVVIVQVESLESSVLEFAVGGERAPVMPNLQRRLENAFYFESAYDQSGAGRTSDAEILAMTSLHPLSGTAAAVRFGDNQFVGLPRVLRDRGYSTVSMVPFDGAFWNRRTTHPAFGFEASRFVEDFEERGARVGWGLNDLEFLAQAGDEIEKLPEPFFALLMTLSLHTPYEEFPDTLRTLPQPVVLDPDPESSPSVVPGPIENYFEAMRLFDTAFDRFMSRLTASGMAGRTLVVLYGDHDAGRFPSDRKRALRIGLRSRNAVRRMVGDRVPLALWVPRPGGQGWGGWTGTDKAAAGLVDVAPTVAGLLGIDARLYPWQGRNLHRMTCASCGDRLSEWRDAAIPVGSGGHWVSSGLAYFNHGAPGHGRRCFDRGDLAQPLERGRCAEQNAAVGLALSVSEQILRGDLQERLLDFGR